MRGQAPTTPGGGLDRFVKTVRLELRSLGDRIAALSRRVANLEVSGGAVESVNGESGVVVIDYSDVGADPAGAAAAAEAAANAHSDAEDAATLAAAATYADAGDSALDARVDALEAAPAGAPSGAGYLVTTSDPGLSAEVPVGASPGGELGGTWASPTVDATHSGSSHAGVLSSAESYSDAALATHAADTTAVHGITDTSALALIAGGLAGRTVFVQTSTPTATAIGDVWIKKP